MAKTKAQEDRDELERIKRQRKLSDWNQGNDPTLDILGEAERLSTDRGYTAAKRSDTREERARNNDIMRRAMEAEPSRDLPDAAKSYVRRKQVELGKLYAQFQRDADEFSGRPVGNYEPLTPRWKQREEAAKKAGEDARKKGEKDWTENAGNELAILGPGKAALAKDGLTEMYQEETPSGGFVSASGQNVVQNMHDSRVRDREQAARAEAFQTAVANNRRNAALSRLTDAGYDWSAADSRALFNEDGMLDAARANLAADRAQGQKAQRTFEAWDADKELQRRATALAKDSRDERRYLRAAQRGDYGLQAQREAQSPQGRDRIARLESSLAAGESDRGGLNAGFWRQEAEKADAAATERRVAMKNIQAADEAKVKSLMENSANLTEAMARLYKDFEAGKITKEQMDMMSAYMADNYGGNT